MWNWLLAPNLEPAAQAIRSDPLFLDEETLVLPVDSVATLEEEGHGLVIERWGRAGGKDHQRFSVGGSVRPQLPSLGQMMTSAARALVTLRPGAHPLDTIPPASLHANRPARTRRRSGSARAKGSVDRGQRNGDRRRF